MFIRIIFGGGWTRWARQGFCLPMHRGGREIKKAGARRLRPVVWQKAGLELVEHAHGGAVQGLLVVDPGADGGAPGVLVEIGEADAQVDHEGQLSYNFV